MAELNREEIIAALQGFTAATKRLQCAYASPSTISSDLAECIVPGEPLEQGMLDLGALLLRHGLETIGLPACFEEWSPEWRELERFALNFRPPVLSDVNLLLHEVSYDVMVLAGYNRYSAKYRVMPAMPKAFTDAPDLWQQVYAMATSRADWA